MSWYSKYKQIVALSSIKIKYIAFTLAAKKVTWLKLLLTKLSFLKTKDQHIKININEKNSSVQTFKDNIQAQKEEKFSTSLKSQAVNAFSTSSENQATNTFFKSIFIDKSIDLISIISNNQSSISLIHNPIFYI